nr:MAG TPA: hypothetical protein [Caudoviricetes sp.]
MNLKKYSMFYATHFMPLCQKHIIVSFPYNI